MLQLWTIKQQPEDQLNSIEDRRKILCLLTRPSKTDPYQSGLVYLERRHLKMKGDKPAYIQTSDEKYVIIESKGLHDVQMVTKWLSKAKISNSRKATVTVTYREDANQLNCMAFCFKLRDKKYFPTVNDNKIEFEEELTSDDKFWFRWFEKTGEWKRLISVANPNMYLCEQGGGKVTIDQGAITLFKIDLKTHNTVKSSNDGSTYQALLKNVKINHNGDPIEGSHLERLEYSTTKYLKTRQRTYIWAQSKVGSSSQMTGEKIEISSDRNPSRVSTRGFIAVKRKLDETHNVNDTTECHCFRSNL